MAEAELAKETGDVFWIDKGVDEHQLTSPTTSHHHLDLNFYSLCLVGWYLVRVGPYGVGRFKSFGSDLRVE